MTGPAPDYPQGTPARYRALLEIDELIGAHRHFEDFFRLLPERADSDRSWTVTRQALEAKGLDLKAVNPNTKPDGDPRTPEELLDLIEAKGREVAAALALLRRLP